jgi:hypothetical protein
MQAIPNAMIIHTNRFHPAIIAYSFRQEAEIIRHNQRDHAAHESVSRIPTRTLTRFQRE